MIEFHAARQEHARFHLAALLRTEKTDTSDGLCSVDELIGGGSAYYACRDGAAVGLVVLRKLDRANGRELEVRAGIAIGKAGRVTEDILPAVEREFGGDCTHITIYTRRGGLVRKLERSGYREAAKIMRKRINEQN